MTGRNFCISLGVNEYADSRLGNLAFAVSDARTIQQITSGTLGYGAQSTLLDERCNAVEFLTELRRFLKRHSIKQGDKVLLYLAGHGVQPKGQDDQFVLLANASVDLLEQDAWVTNDLISLRTLLAELDRQPAEFAIVLDICRANRQSGVRYPGEEFLAAVLAGLASRDIEPVYERSGHEQAVAACASPEAADAQARSVARHLIVNSCGDKGSSLELEALQSGLFAKAFGNWLITAPQKGAGILDGQAIKQIAEEMGRCARSAGLSQSQSPWINKEQSTFVVYSKFAGSAGNKGGGSAAQSGSQVAGTESPGAKASLGRQSATVAYEPRAESSQTSPRREQGAASLRTGWHRELRFRDFDEIWCPVMAIIPASPESRETLAVSVDPITVEQFFSLFENIDVRDIREDSRTTGARRPRFSIANQPVTYVSRAQCDEWIRRLNTKCRRESNAPGIPEYRLLTYQEWKAVCLCGGKKPYMIGSEARDSISYVDAIFRYMGPLLQDGRRIYAPAGYSLTCPAVVDDARNKINAWGLRGMHGNIRELVSDITDVHKTFLMGGGFRSMPQELIAGNRNPANAQQEIAWEDVGFRIARQFAFRKS